MTRIALRFREFQAIPSFGPGLAERFKAFCCQLKVVFIAIFLEKIDSQKGYNKYQTS